jgi:hypothetical protein
MLENFEINKLDITRLYRFIAKLDYNVNCDTLTNYEEIEVNELTEVNIQN